VRNSRLPKDLTSIVSQIRSSDKVQYIVCSDELDLLDPLLIVPAPIHLPSLADRRSELPRIVDEYALDAISTLEAHSACFTDEDRAWVIGCRASSLAEIEKATLRIVALRASRTVSAAAHRLGMAPVSLSRWVYRRRRPPMLLVGWSARNRVSGAPDPTLSP
jgi:hypothetical protein